MTTLTNPTTGYDYKVDTHLSVKECPVCGVHYAIPEGMYDACLRRMRSDAKNGWYCPNGHFLVPTADTLNAVKAKAKRDAELAARREQHLRDRLDHTEAQRRSEKAAKTRIKNRVAKGVCPCCNRSFVDLAKHMAGQHPDFGAE